MASCEHLSVCLLPNLGLTHEPGLGKALLMQGQVAALWGSEGHTQFLLHVLFALNFTTLREGPCFGVIVYKQPSLGLNMGFILSAPTLSQAL